MRSSSVRRKIKWKQLACQRLRFQAKFGVNSALSALQEKYAGAVSALGKKSSSAKLNSDIAKRALPILRTQFFQIRLTQLHCEIAAAVSAAMATVSLRWQWKNRQRNSGGALHVGHQEIRL
jgi:hypothetical protein